MIPPPVSGPYQQMQDANHLRLLVIFHYLIGALLIMGGIALIFGSFFMVQFMETAVTMPPTVVPTPPTPGRRRRDALPYVLGPLADTEHGATRRLEHLAGPGVDLAAHEKRNQHLGVR